MARISASVQELWKQKKSLYFLTPFQYILVNKSKFSKENAMPTYGYECKSCGHTFDAFQSMSDDPIKICPECGKEVRRLINGGTGIIFKGSGFYVTDRKGGSGSVASSKSEKKDTPSPAPACASCADSSCPKAATS
jgi:putative FmdB family regulatory protein